MKIAIVTGASSGIGREFVYAIDRYNVQHGLFLDSIWVVARRADRLEELSKDCSTSIRPFSLDLSNPTCVESLGATLAHEAPQVHFLVNAAGFGIFGSFKDNDAKAQLGIVDLNDRSLTAMCSTVIPYMHKGSSLINIGSNSSWQPVPYMAVYAASKAYVLSLSRALGVELRPQGIHVMCVCPGWIKTEFFDHAVHDDTVKYYDRFYTARQVVDKAMKDLEKRKPVSILGLPVRMQVRLVKHLPVGMVMKTWCRQQKKC